MTVYQHRQNNRVLRDKVWDRCVLTATNEAQASVYRLQLQRLKRAGVLHPETEYSVIPDPDGVRIGSGVQRSTSLASWKATIKR